jgi:hypothetical protein
VARLTETALIKSLHAITMGPVSNLNHFTSVGIAFDARNALNGPCDAVFVCVLPQPLYAGHSIKARYYLGAECIFLSLSALEEQKQKKDAIVRRKNDDYTGGYTHARSS